MLIDGTHAGTALLASFLASLVECVEALTVVLAVGAVRGWRSALVGSGTALLTLFPDAVDVSRPLACAGVLVGLMFPLLMEQVKNWLEAQCARPSPDDARPLLGTPPLSYSTMQSSVLDRRRRVDPGIVSQTFQLRFCFRAWAHLDARKCTPGGT